MFVAIQNVAKEDGIVKPYKMFAAETREELESNKSITYDRIEEYEYAEMYNGVIYTDKAECVAVKNENIRQIRANLYAEQIDPLHAQKQRKVVLGTWTSADEAEYVERVEALTTKIQEENPYVE